MDDVNHYNLFGCHRVHIGSWTYTTLIDIMTDDIIYSKFWEICGRYINWCYQQKIPVRYQRNNGYDDTKFESLVTIKWFAVFQTQEDLVHFVMANEFDDVRLQRF